jgi:hypothetical protein
MYIGIVICETARTFDKQMQGMHVISNVARDSLTVKYLAIKETQAMINISEGEPPGGGRLHCLEKAILLAKYSYEVWRLKGKGSSLKINPMPSRHDEGKPRLGVRKQITL